MPHARPRRPPVGRVATETPTASRILFPGAVSGEQYPRYAKSVWAQAQRWLAKHWSTASIGAGTALDVRLKLRAIAAREIRRHLCTEEEQLLSEIVHAAWTSGARDDEG
jgi:hypothetical protein